MQDLTFLQDYQDYLERAGRSEHTVRAYTQDLVAFARWYEHTTGEALSPADRVAVRRRTAEAASTRPSGMWSSACL